MPKNKLDVVTFEVVRHRLWAINDEAGATIKRITGSPIAHSGDFNTGILTAEGEMVLVGIYISSHASVQDLIVSYLLREYGDNPGIDKDDMFITNDPYIGALHQPDVTCIAPIHWEEEIVAWCGATVHQVDVGGPVPGSFIVGAKSIFEEGTPIPPVKIVEKGKLRKDLEDMYLRRSRIPELVALDLRAQIAANNTVKTRIHKLIQQYGLETVKAVMKEMIHYAEKKFRARLKELPDGTWRHRSYIDHDGSNNDIYSCQLTMTKTTDTLTFDFSESAHQAEGPINCCLSGLRGAVMASTLPLLCYDMPWTPAGLWKTIQLIAKPKTVFNAQWPAAISMSTITGAWAARTMVNVCLGKMLACSEKYKDHAMSSWTGSCQMQLLYGLDQRGEPITAFVGARSGGAGARTYKDGVDCGGIISSMSGIVLSIERSEYYYPILHLYHRRLKDSGGPGKYRGGVGAETAFVSHDAPQPLVINIFGWGVEAPASSGIYGGYPASTFQSAIKRNTNIGNLFNRGKIPNNLDEIDGELEVPPIMSQALLNDGDVLSGASAGGGGYGDPLGRKPELVVQDVLDQLVSPACADNIYGVSLGANMEYLATETEKKRQALKKIRLQDRRVRGVDDHEVDEMSLAVEYLEIEKKGKLSVIKCVKCGFVFCDNRDNYKNYASVVSYPLSKAGPQVNPHRISKRFVHREFCCPQCGVLLETEVCLENDPYLWDIHLKI